LLKVKSTGEEKRKAYRRPVAKTTANPIFLRNGICSFTIMGIGRKKMMTSSASDIELRAIQPFVMAVMHLNKNGAVGL
jgi:hypothetical protein